MRGHPQELRGWNDYKVRASVTSVEAGIELKAFTGDERTLLESTDESLRRAFLIKEKTLEVEFVGMRPDDEHAKWFATIAKKMATTKVKFRWWRPEKKSSWFTYAAAEAWNKLGLERHAHTNALTASAIVLKLYGDMQGVATAFSYEPSAVAADLREAHIVEIFGTDTIRCLLENIYH
jgi:hypothetical protein